MSENTEQVSTAERIVSLFETMMKTLDKIHEEKSYANHREVWKLREETFDPARKELVDLLQSIIKD